MINLLDRLVRLALWLFELGLLAYVLMSWFVPKSNRWTVLLRRVMEPVLQPLRGIINSKLPVRYQVVDFSPVAAYVLCRIVASLWNGLVGIFK